MSANPLAHEDAYCPNCYRLVLNADVFCQYCGQFIHQNAPADSRRWDSRPPQVPAVAPLAEPETPNIDLPEDALPYGAAGGVATEARRGGGAIRNAERRVPTIRPPIAARYSSTSGNSGTGDSLPPGVWGCPASGTPPPLPGRGEQRCRIARSNAFSPGSP